MPVCTLHLLSLAPSTNIPQFLDAVHASDVKTLTIARVVRWIILPSHTSTDTLLAQNIHWDILLTLASTSPLPSSLQPHIAHQWSVKAGVPSRLLSDFEIKNRRLLHPQKSDVPALTGSLDRPRVAKSTQSLELNPALEQWVREFGAGDGQSAVSMLNLLAFKSGKKEQYLEYGKEFASRVGSRRGGLAKIVGTVVPAAEGENVGRGGEGWDEIALAHYPSIAHFADMLASEDYQEVNHKYRVGSLKDTFILCTTEIGMEAGPGLWRKGARL
jgi:hypothetical protein